MKRIFVSVLQRLRYLMVWFSRIRHSLGFGVQSPTDFWFSRYVINERWPYYQYQELQQQVTGLDHDHRRLCELYLRLANYWQPQTIADVEGPAASYLQAGCHRARLVTVGAVQADMVRLQLTGNYRATLSLILNKVCERTMLIVEDLWRDPTFWRELQANERVVVTFDLYYCGIVLFDTKRYKQHYIVNY